MLKYLSFEGGGIKMYSYIGVLRYLCDNKNLKDIVAISGSSAGAFICLCIVLQYNPDELHEIINKFNFPNIIGFFSFCKAIPNLLYNYGLMKPAFLDQIITDVLKKKDIDYDITFIQFYKIYDIDLIITVSNINKMIPIYFNYKNTPDFSVKQACIISMSYPIVFTPTILDNDYLCDGGVFRNLPFKYLEECVIGNKEVKDNNIVGFMFFKKSEINTDSIKINNLFEYLVTIINGLMENNNSNEFLDENRKLDKRICEIIIPEKVNAFSILTEEEKIEMIEIGYNACEKYFMK